MLCSSCGQDNPWDAKVCSSCGLPINTPGPSLDKPAAETGAATVAYSDAGAASGNLTGTPPDPAMGIPPYTTPGTPESAQAIPPYGTAGGLQPQPGMPYYGPAGMQMPPGQFKPIRDYLSWSIITTIISVITCNLLAAGLGVPAIVFSSQGRDKKAMGDPYGAYSAQRNAQIFFWISFGFCAVGVLFWLFYFGIIILSFLGIFLGAGLSSY